VYVPRASQGFHIPRLRFPFVPLAVVGAVVVAWAAFSVRPTGHDAPPPQPIVSDVHSVAYFERAPGADLLMVRRAAGGAAARSVATFPRYLDFSARGSASPRGDTVAVLSVGDRPAAAAVLTLVDPASGPTRVVPGGFQYLSPLAWSADGHRLGALAFSAANEPPAAVEVDTASGTVIAVHRFDTALEVAPVGFTLDGRRMLVVVLDGGGSSLWSVADGEAVRLASLSPGITRDWTLSSDASRLAFVERSGVGGRRYAGRVLALATGTVQRAPGDGDQYGAVWQPGTSAAEFGGPGGSLKLAAGGEAYLVPRAWSPDGTTLVASVFEGGERSAEARTEVIKGSEWRMPLGSNEATFIGWVRDLE